MIPYDVVVYAGTHLLWHLIISVTPWCSGYYYCANFIQRSLKSGSVQIQILLVACRGLMMVRISDNGLGWK